LARTRKNATLIKAVKNIKNMTIMETDLAIPHKVKV
jgi:hypothetical protein